MDNQSEWSGHYYQCECETCTNGKKDDIVEKIIAFFKKVVNVQENG